jgi:hypothetical protein
MHAIALHIGQPSNEQTLVLPFSWPHNAHFEIPPP